MKKKKILRAMVFMTVIGLLFYRCYHILGYYDNIHSSAVFEQFYDLPPDCVDVVWMGPSATQEFVIPSVMYDETGITLYSLSVGNEPFFSTINLIKECERVQNPDIYMIDIRYLAYTVLDDTYVRRITDNMKWSLNRLDAIKYMTENLERYREKTFDSWFDYVFSFTKYHTRWGNLCKEDFCSDENCFFGYFIKTKTVELDENEIKGRFHVAEQPISDENIQYLNDVLNYCDTLEKEIIFTCTPNGLGEEYFAKYHYVKNMIQNRGYQVWDLNEYVDEMGINYAQDFADVMHTNVYGAQKVSRYVAKRLVREYHLADHRGDIRFDVYQKMSENFAEKLQEAEIKATTDFNRYLDHLIALDKNEYTIYIAVKDIQGYQLNQEMIDKLKMIGFDQSDILMEHEYHSFIGVVANDQVLYQQIGQDDEPGHYEGKIHNQTVCIDSMTYQNGNRASIKLGMTDYAKNSRGINIVVVDNKDGIILDSVAFDTYVPEITCKR